MFPSKNLNLFGRGVPAYVLSVNMPKNMSVDGTVFKNTDHFIQTQVTATKAVTRDLDGCIFVWNLAKITAPKNHRSQESDDVENDLLLTKVKSSSKTVTCIAMDERKLLLGSIGHFDVFDYWSLQ